MACFNTICSSLCSGFIFGGNPLQFSAIHCDGVATTVNKSIDGDSPSAYVLCIPAIVIKLCLNLNSRHLTP